MPDVFSWPNNQDESLEYMRVAYVQVSTGAQGEEVTGEPTDNSSILVKVRFTYHYTHMYCTLLAVLLSV